MTPLATAALLYAFSPTTVATYQFVVTFDGFIPVLGGQEGKVEVKMTVGIQGLKPTATGDLQVQSDIQKAEILFNGAPLPIGLDNIKSYFPKTTVVITPAGKLVKTDAPDIALPVKLPGLDIKRFPDISYLPIEFPAGPVSVGTKWDYSKSFSGSLVNYHCEAKSVTDQAVGIALALDQKYDTLEDESLQVVKTEAEAAQKVTTSLEGKGEATFDRQRGLFRTVKVDADTVSEATDLKTKAKTTRKLKTSLRLDLQEGTAPIVPTEVPKSQFAAWWETARIWAGTWSKQADVAVRRAFAEAVQKASRLRRQLEVNR